MADSVLSKASGMLHRTMGAAFRAPFHVLNFAPGRIVGDLKNIVSPQTTPALKSESAGLGTAVNQGAKFIGNTPQEIRQFGH